MESKQRSLPSVAIGVLTAVCVCLVGVLAYVIFFRTDGGEVQTIGEENNSPVLSYAAEGVTVIDDADALQKAVDDAYKKAQEGTVSIRYQNDALSTDGETFSCYIGNPERSEYDMFIDIYADEDLTEQLFLSDLIRPGTAFEEITLTKPLAPGTHTVYVAVTQVEKDLASIHAQVLITMNFIVEEAD